MAKQLESPDQKPTHEEIAQCAYALFEKKGRAPGHDMENWLEAEAQLIAARKSKPEARRDSNGTRSSARQSYGQRQQEPRHA